MKNLLLLALIGAAAYKGYTELFLAQKGAFDADGNPTVLLFTFDNCGKPCADAEKLLGQRQVDYEEIVVSDGKAQQERLESFGNIHTLPFTVIGSEQVVGYNKWETVSALATTFGPGYLTRYESNIFARNFTPGGEPKLVMYTMNGCGYCEKAMEYLQQEGIAFEERNTSIDFSAKSELNYFQAGTPLIFYGYRRYAGWGNHVRDTLMDDLSNGGGNSLL